MRPSPLACFVLCLLLPVTAFAGSDDDYAQPGEALQNGDIDVSLRYRFENVSDDTPAVAAEDGTASTLRTTLSYGSAGFRGFRVFLEFEDVTDIGAADRHSVAGRPGIADPDLTESNQVYVSYGRFPETMIRFGRQEINLGDQRFVGAVGWRQNHQSFDGLRVKQGSIPRTMLDYTYVQNVNRIFGDNKEMQGHLLNAEVQAGKTGRIVPYVYKLDYDSPADAGLSTTTYGARWKDSHKCDCGWVFPYVIELAQQDDTGDNPGQVDAGYRRVEAGAKRENVWFKLGYELLEGSAADGKFTTPLATGHKFNGWADRFLVTPTEGLEDTYLAVGGRHERLSGLIAFHDFASDSAGIDYGSEIDLQVLYKTAWKQVFGLKAAFYDADDTTSSVDKLWIWTAYSF